MAGKAFTWLRRFFELAGAIQTLGAVGGATVLAVILPAATGAVLDLSTTLLVVLGIGVFFVALAIILAVLKAVLERQPPTKGAQSYQEVAFMATLMSENERLRKKDERLTEDVEALEKKLEEASATPSEVGTPIVESEDSLVVIQRLTDERDALKEANERLSANLQQIDEELKQRFFGVSRELFRFADERDEKDPRKKPEQTQGWRQRSQKRNDYDKETQMRYSKEYGGEVGAL